MSDDNQLTCRHGAVYGSDYQIEGITLGPPFPREVVERAIAFPFASEDVLVASYPQSGESFVGETVWLLTHAADVTAADAKPLAWRLPLIEMDGLDGAKPPVDSLLTADPPRVMATHLPYSLIGNSTQKGRPRVLVVLRDPLDVVVDVYRLYRKWPGRCLPSFDYFFETFFKTDRVLFGNHIEHLLGYWNRRHQGNFLVMKYEEMVENVEDTVLKISNFLERDLPPSEMHAIVKYMSQHKAAKSVRKEGRSVQAILGVRLVETHYPIINVGTITDTQKQQEMGNAEDNQSKKNKDKDKCMSMEMEGDYIGDNSQDSDIFTVFKEVEFVCTRKPLQLSSEQDAYIREQRDGRLKAAGLVFSSN